MQGGYGGGYGGGAPGGGGGGWGPPAGGAPPGGAPPGGGYGGPPGGAPPGGGYGGPPGAPPPGGGYGAPPGGGYGAPPGGGYGAPPGGGWAPPPQGGAPGGGGFNPMGNMGPGQAGLGRFFKSAAIGGAIGGILCSIPILDCLNWCFCLLNMAGAVIGVQMYLKENAQEQLNNGDAAACGAIAGVVAGFVRGILGLIIGLTLGPMLFRFYQGVLPPDVLAQMGRQFGASLGMSVVMIPLYAILYGGFGAIGGVLAMSLFFKDRAKK